ncbi:hypothetical protein HanIR_Chr10g0478761 [Helianthus annuus]|nr:hypothetical protein HanIR_Chr10g0478761 [Helianthus annuus]
MTSKASNAKIKRKGDSRSPWRNPRDNLNSSVGDLFTKTDALLDLRLAPIHFLHKRGKFIAFRLESRNFQFMESYAFSKSTLNIKTCFFSKSELK